MTLQRTDIEPDDYVPVAKHARRVPVASHVASPAGNATNNGHGGVALAARPGPPPTREHPAARPDPRPASNGSGAGAGHPLPPDAGAAPNEIDRVSAVWRARYAIVASTLLVGIAVYALAGSSAPVYSSSATVSITAATTPTGSAQDVALASNSLAAQDTLLVTSDAVVTAAVRHLSISPSELSSHLTSGTLNSQNLIQITAQAPTSDDALQWVRATSLAFQAYLQERAQTTSRTLRNSITAETESLNQQIDLLQYVIDNAQDAVAGTTAMTDLENDESQLTQLIGTRATLTDNTALAIASEQPVVSVIVTGSEPAKVSPRPTFYAVVAALLTLLVAAQVAIFAARRRASRAAPR